MTSTTSKRKRMSGLSSIRSQLRPPREMRFCFSLSTAAIGRPKSSRVRVFTSNKNQRVPVATDDVDLAAATAFKIAVEDFVPVTPQQSSGEFCALGATPELLRAG